MGSARRPAATWVAVAELEYDPHPTLARLRHELPVAWVPALDGWMVSRRKDVVNAMRDDAGLTVDDARFSTGQVIGPSMLSTDGAEHTRQRAPFARPFRLDAIRSRFTREVASEVDRLIDAFADTGQAELRTQLAAPLAARMMLLALGFETANEEELLDWYTRIVEAVTRITAGEPVPKSGLDAYAAFETALHATLATADPEASLLAAALGDAAALTHDELTSNAAVLLFGGIETTEGMIANLLHHLLSTNLFADVAADPVLLDGAIEESLRLEPAAAVLDRYATSDLEIAGVTIPRGDLVVLSIASANRDEELFAEPDRFDPSRRNGKLHTTFATGPHVCLGMHLARLEARVAVTGLAHRLPNLCSDGTRPSQPRGLVFRKPPAVWATF
ncbi:MAG: cytochrome P450 [Thermoleophilia bacterium]|nr:cytochrome P450 [Thermoleophilia bacterium]